MPWSATAPTSAAAATLTKQKPFPAIAKKSIVSSPTPSIDIYCVFSTTRPDQFAYDCKSGSDFSDFLFFVSSFPSDDACLVKSINQSVSQTLGRQLDLLHNHHTPKPQPPLLRRPFISLHSHSTCKTFLPTTTSTSTTFTRTKIPSLRYCGGLYF